MDEPGPNGSVEKLKQGGQRVIVILFKDTSQTALGFEAPLLEQWQMSALGLELALKVHRQYADLCPSSP